MRLSISSFRLPILATPDPVNAQAALVASISEHGDVGRAVASLIERYLLAQQRLDQRHLDQAARDMNEAIDSIRREFDWISIGVAAKLIRIRRVTLHAAVVRNELDHRILIVRGVPARHVRRCDVLDWHEARGRAQSISVKPPSSAA